MAKKTKTKTARMPHMDATFLIIVLILFNIRFDYAFFPQVTHMRFINMETASTLYSVRQFLRL